LRGVWSLGKFTLVVHDERNKEKLFVFDGEYDIFNDRFAARLTIC